MTSETPDESERKERKEREEMPTLQRPTLLPCPFCGERVFISTTVEEGCIPKYGKTKWFAFCAPCNAKGPWADFESEAHEKWNGRHRVDGSLAELLSVNAADEFTASERAHLRASPAEPAGIIPALTEAQREALEDAASMVDRYAPGSMRNAAIASTLRSLAGGK